MPLIIPVQQNPEIALFFECFHLWGSTRINMYPPTPFQYLYETTCRQRCYGLSSQQHADNTPLYVSLTINATTTANKMLNTYSLSDEEHLAEAEPRQDRSDAGMKGGNLLKNYAAFFLSPKRAQNHTII